MFQQRRLIINTVFEEMVLAEVCGSGREKQGVAGRLL